MKLNYILLLIATFIFSTENLFADSPLTSTAISDAYKDSKIVQAAAKAQGKLTTELMKYLTDSKNPLDEKIAVINELSWDINGKNNSTVFIEFLKEKRIYKNPDDFLNNADGDILICLAYLKALDNYLDVEEAISYAQKAKSKNAGSYTVNIVCALIEAQKAFNTDWCAVYKLTDNVRNDVALTMDMKKEAIAIIFDYMDLYKEYCKQ